MDIIVSLLLQGINRPESLAYVSHFEALLSMGLRPKLVLEHLPNLFPDLKPIHEAVSKRLQQGTSLTVILSELLYGKQGLGFSLKQDAIDLKSWLKQSIAFCKEQKEKEADIKKRLSYGGLLFMSSFSIIVYLFQFYLPHMMQVFEGTQEHAPTWAIMALALSSWFSSYWDLMLIGLFSAAYLSRGYLLSYVETLRLRLFYSKYLSQLAMLLSLLLKQGLDLDNIARSIQSNPNYALHKQLLAFKEQVLGQHNADAAFAVIFNQPFYKSIITQSLNSNRLDEGLAYLSRYLQDKQIKDLDLASRISTIALMLLTACCICLGFYTSVLPLTTLLGGLK